MMYDQDTIKVPVTSMSTQQEKYPRRRMEAMTTLRVVSLLVMLLVMLGSILVLFSYPNNLDAFFVPQPTPVHPQCAYGHYSMTNGTPVVYISEVCK